MRSLSRLRKPVPYIDTNVILDYIRKRDDNSILLLQTILNRKIKTYTTAYTILELIDHQQEDGWIAKRVNCKESFEDILRQRYPRKLDETELNSAFHQIEERFFKPFIDSEIIYVGKPTKDSWDDIIELMHHYNISIGDAFHIAMAQDQGCNVFITKDGDLATMATEHISIVAGSPKDINGKMKSNGIQPFWK